MTRETEGRQRGRRFRTVMTGIGVGLGATIISGVAFAAWTVDGSGSVSDKGGSVLKLEIIAAPAPNADLFPGKKGAAQFTVKNNNPFAVKVNSMTFGAVTTSDPTNCPATNLTADPATVALALDVAATSTSAPQSLANAFTLSADAPNGCQGVTFTVAATATGTQQ